MLKQNSNSLEIYDTVNEKIVKTLNSDTVDHLIMQNDGNCVSYTTGYDFKFVSGTHIDNNIVWPTDALPSKVVGPHEWFNGGVFMTSPNKEHNVAY